jgi:leucyl aminopeptidase
MAELVLAAHSEAGVPILAVGPSEWPELESHQPPASRRAAAAAKFTGAAGQCVIVPGKGEEPGAVLFGLGAHPEPMLWRTLAGSVPSATYRLVRPLGSLDADQAALGWTLGAYRFDRYRNKPAPAAPRLLAPPGCDLAWTAAAAAACATARDMINTPANDMGPAQVEAQARRIAQDLGAEISVITGEALLGAGYPAVHAVGRAAVAERAPRMIEITVGDKGLPLLALVGKGVVFDSGGLDIKPSAGMRHMKKDMGGAAHVLALARMVVAAGVGARVAVILPVVENAIAGDAMRPGDVLASRSGLTIEVGNTDAEGRLILADALARAGELDPALTIDMATLTGAARIALGPQVIPFFTADETLAGELAGAAEAVGDPLWRMPLWGPYAEALDSDIADIRNDADPWAQAGCVTAALFLQRFAPTGPWAHLDIFAWNPRSRPGFPQGAEIQAIRALFAMVRARFS